MSLWGFDGVLRGSHFRPNPLKLGAVSTTLTPNNADAGGADYAHAESGKNNKTAMVTTAIGFIARFGLAVVWLVSGWQKLADPVTTKQSVAAYELFSRDVSDLIGTALPVVEIALGVMLLAGIFLRATAAVSGIIFAVFIAGIISAWARGLTIDCGCFGGGGYNANVTAWTYLSEILRDLVFAAGAAWVVKWPFKKWALYV